MTPNELREAAAIARRWRERMERTRQKRIEGVRVEAERERANRRLANLGQAGKRKLNPEAVRTIRLRVSAGEKLQSVANSYGVTVACVCMVARGAEVEGGGGVILDPSITCGKCAATSPLDQWKGPLGAEFPPNRFQCPKCAWAFERRPAIRHGQYVIRCVAVDPELALAGGGR